MMKDGNPFLPNYGTICQPPRPWPDEAREAADHRLWALKKEIEHEEK